MFEHQKNGVLPKAAYRRRILRYFAYSVIMLSGSLGLGMIGYHFLADLNWIDSFYNAAMILTGMGPANEMPDNTAKIFSGSYALFSGIAFLSTVAVLFAPVAHRFLHVLHVEEVLT